MFTSASNFTYGEAADLVHPLPSFSLSCFLILFCLLLLGLPISYFPYSFLTKSLYAFLATPYACYMRDPSHPSSFDHPNNICLRLLNLEAQYYEIFSSIFLCSHSWRRLSSSVPSSRTSLDQWRTQEFCSAGVQQIQLRAEGRENDDLEAVAP